MFHALIRGEDHTEFTIELDATTRNEAFDEAEDLYPDGVILEIFDPEVRAEEIYRRAERAYDDPDADLYW